MYVSRRTALEASTLFRGSRKGVVRPSVRARAKEERSLKSKTNRVSQRLLNVEIRSLLLLSLSLSFPLPLGGGRPQFCFQPDERVQHRGGFALVCSDSESESFKSVCE